MLLIVLFIVLCSSIKEQTFSIMLISDNTNILVERDSEEYTIQKLIQITNAVLE